MATAVATAPTNAKGPLMDQDDWDDLAASMLAVTAKAASSVTSIPVKRMIEYLDARWPLSKATSILDTGCGPGVVMDELIREYGQTIPESAELRAADFSPAMVEQARNRKEQRISEGFKVWERVSVDASDAQELEDLEDESVSHAMAGFVFMLVPEPRKALTATRRVLTSQNGGGVLCLSCWQGSEWIDLMNLIKVVRPDKDPMTIPKAWWSPEGVKGEMEATGYKDIETTTVETTMQFDNHKNIVRFFIQKMPHMKKCAEDMSQGELDELERMMIEKLKSWYPVAPAKMKGTAILAVGRK